MFQQIKDQIQAKIDSGWRLQNFNVSFVASQVNFIPTYNFQVEAFLIDGGENPPITINQTIPIDDLKSIIVSELSEAFPNLPQ